MKIENNLEIIVKLNEIILNLVANKITEKDIIKLQFIIKEMKRLYKNMENL